MVHKSDDDNNDNEDEDEDEEHNDKSIFPTPETSLHSSQSANQSAATLND